MKSRTRFENFADPEKFDQGIGGFIENILLENFRMILELAQGWSGAPVRVAHRKTAVSQVLLDAKFLSGIDTLVIISFDSLRTRQQASSDEVAAVAEFLKDGNHTAFICSHHDIGNVDPAIPRAVLR